MSQKSRSSERSDQPKRETVGGNHTLGGSYADGELVERTADPKPKTCPNCDRPYTGDQCPSCAGPEGV